MPPAEHPLAARTLLALALVAILVHAAWSLRTPTAANADRYDYLGRAEQFRLGHGLRPMLEYPLRFAFGGAERLPTEDIVRPPMWPLLMLGPMAFGAGEAAGVFLAALCAAITAFLAYRLAAQRFGIIAGGAAALAFALSFATRRAIWGGGPELALACLLLLLWSWRPSRQSGGAHLAAASVYGALPLLHPMGWLLATAAALARPQRYERRWWLAMIVVALAIGAPWYLRNAIAFGVGGGSLQAQAELAKSLDDAGGLGPYRTATPRSTLSVLLAAPLQVGKTLLSRLKQRLLRLDAWLAWPLVFLALWGTRGDPPLARRDLVLAGACVSVLLCFSPEARLLLPFLPLGAVWAGAGAARLVAFGVPWPTLVLLAWLPWLIPVGLAMRPGRELDAVPLHERQPAPAYVAALVAATQQPDATYLTDSAALTWRGGKSAIFLPDRPQTLQWLRQQPALSGLSLLALSGGTKGSWLDAHRQEWLPWIAAAETIYVDENGALLLRLPKELSNLLPVGPGHELRADHIPGDLVEVPAPPATREGIQLRADCWFALSRLLAAALADGVELRVVSGYRSFEYQAQLYASARDRHGATQGWVAAPGQSEHQLGDAADLADSKLEHVLQASFGDSREGQWLRAHAERFAFRLSYTAENERETGIHAEPWHVRFVGGDRCRPRS